MALIVLMTGYSTGYNYYESSSDANINELINKMYQNVTDNYERKPIEEWDSIDEFVYRIIDYSNYIGFQVFEFSLRLGFNSRAC